MRNAIIELHFSILVLVSNTKSISMLKKIDFRDLFIYLKYPNQEEQYDINSASIFFRLAWKSVLILIAIDIIAGILIVIPLSSFNLFPSLKEVKFTPINILKITLLFPIIEELIFRLPLRICKINYATSLSLILFVVLNKWINYNVYIALILSVVLFLCLNLGIRGETNFIISLTNFFTTNYWSVFYFQAIIFGFLHLGNYAVDYKYFYLFPFIVLSYISKGCLLGYLRIRFSKGIYLSIASHIVANSVYCFFLAK
jgi:hypothetical protein